MLLRLKWIAPHHGYYGLVLIGLSYYYSSYFLYVIGVVLFLDDLYQHWRQVKEPLYHSPIHVLYGRYLYNIPMIHKLNVYFDKLTGVM